MKFNPDDPKWTSYVLGELSDEDRAAVEEEMAASAAAREAVDEIRMASTLLRDELEGTAPAGLLAQQRRLIHKQASPGSLLRFGRFVPVAVAAGLVAAVVTFPVLVRYIQEPATNTSAEQKQQLSEPIVPAGNGRPAEILTTRNENEPDGSPVPPSRIAGTVRDETGAALPGATITVTRKDTGLAVNTIADADGSYVLPDLPSGPYKVEAELPGFRTFVENEVVVQGNNARQINPVLEVGQVAQAMDSLQGARIASRENYATELEKRSVGLERQALTQSAAAAPPPMAMAPMASGRFAPVPEFDFRAAADIINNRPLLNTETYDQIVDNPFIQVAQDPLATFSTDVDTASYANMRRFLSLNQLPPRDSVRIEEMINYFTYDYAPPTGSRPVAVYTEVAASPWKPAHRLVRIGIKGKDINMSNRASTNLVFLIDVSGSMNSPEKLPLLKSAMKLMIDKLTENDRVAIVVYAGSSGLVLPPTSGDKKERILQAIDSLTPGGSTNGASGIKLAYDTAVAQFIRGGINRVVLATDGDFNVGITNQGDLLRLIEDKARSNVFLSVLGFGMGNYKDSTLEKLADQGNGNYAYIDTLNEARKVLVEELGGTLVTIAKDVKIQIEFNPAQVNAYRLIGYENRILRHEDFNNDAKDAGDMGAGHTVTALFEVVPKGVELSTAGVDPLKYQQPAEVRRPAGNAEMLNVKIRYKDPEGTESKLLEVPVADRGSNFNAASTDFRFAAAVASFGMILRDSPHKGSTSLDSVAGLAERSLGSDKSGYREEFVRLVRKARTLSNFQ